jgi:uncharacterized membrane-anchored protein
LALPQGDVAVFGADAQRAYKLLGNPTERPGLEATVIGGNDGNQMITFESSAAGYVGLDDWSEVNPEALLAEISRQTEAENQQRRQQGAGFELHVRGWLQPPTLDHNTTTVYWALLADQPGETALTVNTTALRLNRNGFEKVTWYTSKDQYQAAGNELDVMLRAHSFAPGSTYADHISTDTMAGYGIATLVGTVLGAKAVKVPAGGTAAGALAGLAKLFPVLFAAIAGAFYKLVQWLRRRGRKPASGE